MENVRMGEMIVSSIDGAEIAAIGLGSCIGLALIDPQAGVAGLAHVVLPESGSGDGPAAKFGDTVVPALLGAVEAQGAIKHRVIAILVGGAKMFALGSIGDIGARNATAVRDALKQAGIKVYFEDVGGSRGRTARITIGGSVSVQLAGGERTTLLEFHQPMSAPLTSSGPTRFAGARP
jgi:chemotaxis protein CheD